MMPARKEMIELATTLREQSISRKPYYFKCKFPSGHLGYMFVLSPEHREEELIRSIKRFDVPPFATVTSAGKGLPDEDVMLELQLHYGFDPMKVVPITLCDASPSVVN
ncbi:MAG: hypothetical protein EAZ52_06990 [Alphaproteobacteria bacterium]|nr:MAG: hypothetical protein EAZ66_03390 [Alphaproteobacteria bacterium]TAF75287.1 MAG: hypothetical protein EAZ52_06990 [Alphaproteobacteria bacterium]